MRTQYCTQLAFVVLLIVTAFPHQYQTQDSDIDDDNNGRTTTPYKDLLDERHDTNPTNKVSKKNESRRCNDGQIETGSGKNPHKVKFDHINSTKETVKELGSDFNAALSKINTGQETEAKKRENRKLDDLEQREIDDAVEYGLKRMRDLYYVKEPELYKMGYFLEKNHPGHILGSFRAPNERALNYARYGYAALQARTKLAELYPESAGRESPGNLPTLRSGILQDECPLQGIPRCPPGFERYRTADGTCNNFQNPWRGASMLPMQRFLPPHYDDGIQSVRRSVLGGRLPSPRDISTRIHRDKNREMPTVTMMFMQWGQFLDHDVTSSVQATMFNRSVPRCCEEGGAQMLPPEFTHPECLPIPVSGNDGFLSQFGIRCIEFVRSAPTSRIDCDLGWREQISQVTAYIDASTVYGSDPDMGGSLRLFRKGQLLYGRSRTQGPLQPPDPPEGELCRLGAVTTDCFKGGDLRIGDQPGLTALHTVWLRYHNRIALRLANMNPHWSDEKIYQEARRIVGALVQHITYREFLPIVLGQEVMKLFELDLERKGYYKGYNIKVNPAPANSFGSAAFRFGHSLVQKSFIRMDSGHRMIRNNVTLHEEQQNIENLWSFGSIDRLLLGLANQPTQRRDEFISEELTNHLFQSPGFPFGMDLASINIQRGRDHGLPSYTAWREPCGLVPLRNWTDFERIMSAETVGRFRSLYAHFDDIDLFSGGLAEKPVRGGIVGPTFACIIAQQFSNLRRGDRFWYENGNFESSFTPAQLQQLRRVTFSHILCATTEEIKTIQPFVFLSADKFRNVRVSCNDPSINRFELHAWAEKVKFRRSDDSLDDVTENYIEEYYDDEESEGMESRERPNKKRSKVKPTSRRRTTTKATAKRVARPTAYVNNRPVSQNAYGPFKIKVTNITSATVNLNKKKQTAKKRPLIIYQRPAKKPINKRPYIQGFPTKKPFPTERPTVDGYLINTMPESDSSLNTARPTRPQGQGQGPYHVNINIHFAPPNGQTQPPDRQPTYDYDSTTKRTKPPSRPLIVVNPYDKNDHNDHNDQNEEGYTNRPPNSYYEGPFVTKRPSYSYNRPQSEYGNFQTVAEPTNVRPVYRPPNNYETVFEDVPFATSSRPSYGYNTFKHKIPTMRPVVIPSYLYLNEEPDHYHSTRPTYNRRPYNPYKTDDNEDPNTEIPDYNYEPNVNYFTSQYKQSSKPEDHESPDDEKFVKISSIQGQKLATAEEMKNPVYISVQQREGELELLPEGEQHPGDSPLIQVDVVPSEIRMNEWQIYNEIEDITPDLPMYDLIEFNNASCTSELPQPIKLNFAQN